MRFSSPRSPIILSIFCLSPANDIANAIIWPWNVAVVYYAHRRYKSVTCPNVSRVTQAGANVCRPTRGWHFFLISWWRLGWCHTTSPAESPPNIAQTMSLPSHAMTSLMTHGSNRMCTKRWQDAQTVTLARRVHIGRDTTTPQDHTTWHSQLVCPW